MTGTRSEVSPFQTLCRSCVMMGVVGNFMVFSAAEIDKDLIEDRRLPVEALDFVKC